MTDQARRRLAARPARAAGVVFFAAALTMTVTDPGLAAPRPTPTVAAGGRVMPLPAGSYRLSAGFGQAGPLWASGYHTGQDFSVSNGTPILAAAAGIVVFAGNGGRYGNLTEIAHADGTQTWYAHQSSIGVRVGMRVTAGQRIGAVGSTGNSTGPHLHFELRVGGQTTDPIPWLSGAPAVAGAGSLGAVSDPARAAELRAQLAEAEDVRRGAELLAVKLRRQAELAAVQAQAAQQVAAAARARISRYVRDVYIVGIDPDWLLQADALSAADPGEYADRQTYLRYSHGAQHKHLAAAADAEARAVALRDETTRLRAEADGALAAAEAKMHAVEVELELAAWSWASEGQWDGVAPAGGSKAADAALRFALAQVGRLYSLTDSTGPRSFSCSGLVWRAWKQAGLRWPLQLAHDQAMNRKWVVPVSPGQEQPGDLVFFRVGNGTDPRPNAIDHVGMVVNPSTGVFVHASSPRTGVEINNYLTSTYYRDHRVLVGRAVVPPG